MNLDELPARPVDEEISALIETLLATEQRLEELTGGEVDSVTGRNGRTFLLRRAQEQLRYREAAKLSASLNELRVVFDLVPAMIWFKDTENRFLRVNKRVAETTGMLVGEIEGKSAYEIFPKEAAGYYADDLEVIHSGKPKMGIVENLRGLKGQELWVQTDKVPVCDKDGKVTGLVAMVHDITERRRNEELLRLLSSAVEQSRESILITDAQLDEPGPRIVFVNPAFTRMTGYRADEVLGKTPRILQGPHTDMAVMARLRHNLEQGECFEGEAINYRKDGTEFILEWQVAPMRNPGGKVTHFVAIQRDITQRRTAEDALRTSEKRFKALFEQAAMGVAQADAATGRFVHVNQRFCHIVGHSREELMELTFGDITHPDDVAGTLDSAQRMRTGAIREYTQEKRYRRTDGVEVWASVTVSVMWAPGETPDWFVAIVEDITDRKKMEEQFRQAQKMEAIGTLAGGIAHDFNNILTAIMGYTELVQMKAGDDPDVQECLGAVMQSSRRAADLVRQILAFSRQQRAERKPIMLLPVVDEVLKLLRSSIPTTIEFESALAANAPIVLADASQVHQVLMNLGTNAWHAMKDHPGRLSVTLERWQVDAALAVTQPRLRKGLYARITVSDTGSGMDQATLRRVFEPFFTTKPVGEGTGLGLAVVHGIMDSHEGAVTVYSQPGEGTVFRLYFPAFVGKAAEAAPGEEAVPHGRGERILFVDDESLLVLLGRLTLKELGYEVETANDPKVALAMFTADPQRYALVITDQTMPGMTGLVLASQLSDIRPGVPIIMTTGYSLSLTPERVKEAGICKLLLKPVAIPALGAAVHAALSPPATV